MDKQILHSLFKKEDFSKKKRKRNCNHCYQNSHHFISTVLAGKHVRKRVLQGQVAKTEKKPKK